jgi:hypothetical protein
MYLHVSVVMCLCLNATHIVLLTLIKVVLNRFLEGFVFQTLYKEAFHNQGKINNLQERVPGHIVFVDDRVPNLDSVAIELRASRHFKIPVTTYHYRRASYRHLNEVGLL